MSAEGAAGGVPALRMGSGAMFDGIAPRYDLLNRLMSVGLDEGWRRRATEALAPAVGGTGRILDLATGTADLALRLARRYPEARVIGVDPSAGMLEVGRGKVGKAGLDERVRLEAGDAQDLPFEDDHFDGCTIAFGIRNVPDRARGLREMARVVRPGGRIAVLELCAPKKGLMAALTRFQISVVVPLLGALLSGGEAYGYLRDSVRAFPAPEEFAQTIRDAGLHVVRVDRMGLGACALFTAEVPGGGER